LSEDLIGFNAGDANLYRYVFNSPINLIDPFGENLFFPTSCACAGGAVWGGFGGSGRGLGNSGRGFGGSGRGFGGSSGLGNVETFPKNTPPVSKPLPFPGTTPSSTPRILTFPKNPATVVPGTPPFPKDVPLNTPRVTTFPGASCPANYPDLSPPFLETNHGDTGKNARELRKNMEAEGQVFNPGDEAHHIVPSTDSRTQAARDVR
jgi:hypothetical protein